ncbi:MAG: sigma-70 family RNA polymerase sigma factor [Solirubrobacteraceae bacterium]
MPGELPALVSEAGNGDQAAWGTIVERFSGLVWSTTRAHRLSAAEAADAAQSTWLRLVENLDRIEDPERLGAWLATTARRECLRIIRMGKRELPSDEEWMFETESGDAIEARLLARERDQALWRAFDQIEERCQSLLRLVCAPEQPSYDEVAAALGIPVGAIGPTRARCLDKLRRQLDAHGADLR